VSVNKHLPHIYVLPEDDADRRLANGFHLEVDRIRQMQVLPAAGGWNEVLNSFNRDHVGKMERWTNRFMVLVIDFDGHEERLADAKKVIPAGLIDRVFILGALTEPEDLTADLGLFEEIGRAMARDCRSQTDTTWGHELLRHNAAEIERMRDHVRPILFGI